MRARPGPCGATVAAAPPGWIALEWRAVALFHEDVLRALQDGGVRYVLVGGTAVILHGVPVAFEEPETPRCWRLSPMAERRARRGVVHVTPTEKLLAFRAVPAAEKLRWLEAMRQFLERFLTPERAHMLHRFRRGDL